MARDRRNGAIESAIRKVPAGAEVLEWPKVLASQYAKNSSGLPTPNATLRIPKLLLFLYEVL
jgi:hypothetical protein